MMLVTRMAAMEDGREREENILNLVPKVIPPTIKPPMYRSKHDFRAPLTGSTIGTFGTTQPLGGANLNRKNHGTMGLAKGAITVRHGLGRQTATSIIQKGANTSSSSSSSSSNAKFSYTDRRMPGVPSKDESPVTGLRSTKNYVLSNAVDTMLAVPGFRVHAPPPEPDYLQKEDYGRPPAYLEQVKAEIASENEMIDKYVKDQMGITEEVRQKLEPMDEYERCELLEKLKDKWDAVNERYQTVSHITTLSDNKRRFKEAHERELDELESDIRKLEYPVLIVPDEQEY